MAATEASEGPSKAKAATEVVGVARPAGKHKAWSAMSKAAKATAATEVAAKAATEVASPTATKIVKGKAVMRRQNKQTNNKGWEGEEEEEGTGCGTVGSGGEGRGCGTVGGGGEGRGCGKVGGGGEGSGASEGGFIFPLHCFSLLF